MNLDESVILIETELNVAQANRQRRDLKATYLHLERAKNEIERAIYETWHDMHTAPRSARHV